MFLLRQPLLSQANSLLHFVLLDANSFSLWASHNIYSLCCSCLFPACLIKVSPRKTFQQTRSADISKTLLDPRLWHHSALLPYKSINVRCVCGGGVPKALLPTQETSWEIRKDSCGTVGHSLCLVQQKPLN